jgi:hypothetical protein
VGPRAGLDAVAKRKDPNIDLAGVYIMEADVYKTYNTNRRNKKHTIPPC